MKARLPLLAVLFLVGCGAPVEERILGQWVLDVEAFKDLDQIRNLPEAERRGALDSIEIRAPKFTFTAEMMTFEMAGGGGVIKRETSYRFASREGDRFVLVAMDEDGKTQRLECEFDGATLIIAMDGQAVAFKRANR
jgi:hypothetical protein